MTAVFDEIRRRAVADWEELQRKVYEAQAKELEEALISALPGGTYNRLLARMLERKAGLLIIPLGG